VERKLLLRGVLAGACGGLLAFVFARIFAEPVIGRAIAYESARDAATRALDRGSGRAVEAAGPEVFSRTVQANTGIGVGMIGFGVAMGALVAVAYCLCLGRTGGLRPRPLALLVSAAGFVTVFAVPFAKYPANPPAIGHPETIRARGSLFLTVLLVGVIGAIIAVVVGQRLRERVGTWSATLVAGAGYVVLLVVLFRVLPPVGHLHANLVAYGRHVTETPLPLTDAGGRIVLPGFPADVLADFRLYAVGAQLIMWSVIGLVFAPLAERVLGSPQRRTAPLLS